MSGTVLSKRGRINQVISDSVDCTTLTVQGASTFKGPMYNTVRPFCYLRDTTAATAVTSKGFTVGSVIQNTGAMYNAAQPTRVYFPVNGVYTLTHVSYSTATILTTLTMNTTMSISNGVATTPTLNIGSATLSSSPCVLSSTWTGYQTANAYATFSTSSSLPANHNAGGAFNYIQALLIHWL
jgi:hypothetical protein